MDKVSNEERDGEEWEDKNRILCGEMRNEKTELFERGAQKERTRSKGQLRRNHSLNLPVAKQIQIQ